MSITPQDARKMVRIDQPTHEGASHFEKRITEKQIRATAAAIPKIGNP